MSDEAKKEVEKAVESTKASYKKIIKNLALLRDEGLKIFDVVMLLIKKIGVPALGAALLALALDPILAAAGLEIGVLETYKAKLDSVGITNVWGKVGVTLVLAWSYLKRPKG